MIVVELRCIPVVPLFFDFKYFTWTLELLLIFTRRLCEFEPDNVEYWVQQDYFPIQECIQISRVMKNCMAEARLVEKLGDGTTAI